jgi:hypothetical protein
MTVLSTVIVVAMELMINMHIVVDVVGEKLIFVAATSAQATLSYDTPHLRCFVGRHRTRVAFAKHISSEDF